MECPSCGTECAVGARFCWSCGHSLVTPTEERRVVTVLFADLVGFTAMSESRDPEEVKRLVEAAFERLVVDVTAFGGKVDKIVGDAIIALFGAPVAHEDDAERAVRAALRMQETLAEYAATSDANVRMRIGVNTGEVLVGALRAGGDYTAMGDVVNTASRLQTMAGPDEVLVGETTYLATSEVIEYESRGALVARGRERPVNVWVASAALLPPGHRPRRRFTPLVGREHEMALLTNAVHVSIESGRGLHLVILGEAGVGKTRVANELAEVVGATDGVFEVSGRCVPYGESNPWWPVAEALRDGCRVDRDESVETARPKVAAAVGAFVVDDVGAGEDRTITDGLLHLMGYDTPLRLLPGSRARAEATGALLRFIEGLVQRRPLLVRLADLHWADDVVLELIDELSTQLARQPFVMVATARRSLQERWSPRWGRFNSMVLNLSPLDRTAAEVLLDSLGGRELSPVDREALLDRSGGNPFYLEELVTLVGHGAGLGTPEAPGTFPETLPDTLRGLVAARVDGLTPDEQHVLEDAAVWGSAGPLRILDLTAQATRGVESVADVVSTLVDKDVLTLDGEEWSFRSDLVREVAYARLTRRDRMQRHLGIARNFDERLRLDEADDSIVETVARHYYEAVGLTLSREGRVDAALVDRAALWILEAARRTEQSGLYVQAERLYSQLLGILGESDHARRFEALTGRSRSRVEQWLTAEAREDASAAMEAAEATGDVGARAQAYLSLAAAASRSGEIMLAEEELDAALDLFDTIGDGRGRAEALRQRGMSRLLRGDHRSAEEPIAAALEAFRMVGDRRGEAWSLQNLAWIAFTDGRLDESERVLAVSRSAFEEVGDAGGLAWVEGLRSYLLFIRGDLEGADQLAAKVLRESERRGDRYGEGMMRVVRAGVRLWRGRTFEAVEESAVAVTALRAAGDPVGLEQALSVAGRAEVMSGSVERGLDLLAEARTQSAVTSTGFARAVSRSTEVQLGQPELTLGDLLSYSESSESPVGVDEVVAIGALALAQAGRLDEAAALLGVDDGIDGLPGRTGYLTSAAAIVCAALGRLDDTRTAAALVAEDPTATYVDRATADLALALAVPGPEGDAVLERIVASVSATDDAVTTALVALAVSVRTEVTHPDPEAPARVAAAQDSERRLASLGITDTAWRDLYRRIAARA